MASHSDALFNDDDAQEIWNACRAALLQGAESVSQTYELPQTQFEQVADLYEMQFDNGRTCAFHTDGAKAAQWLLACDGNKVQEYVRIERYQEAVIGNSPVIPDDWVMVPKEPTQAMIKAWLSVVANFRGHAAGYKAALAAAPQREVK
ncbi:eaa protein [Salmonella enterica subsp. enterica serovar Newport]